MKAHVVAIPRPVRGRVVAGLAVAAGLVCSTTVSAAPPQLPRAGCAQVLDPAGDATMPLGPTAGPSDDSLDLTGLSVHRTPASVFVYLSVASLTVPSKQAAAVEYDAGFGYVGRTVSMWVEDFGPAQPARDGLPPVPVPVTTVPFVTYGGYTLFPATVQAQVTSGSKTTPIPATATLDGAHKLVIFTLDRRALERALGAPLRTGRALDAPRAATGNDEVVQNQPYDELRGARIALGTRDTCF